LRLRRVFSFLRKRDEAANAVFGALATLIRDRRPQRLLADADLTAPRVGGGVRAWFDQTRRFTTRG
jgi:hypothetical protein